MLRVAVVCGVLMIAGCPATPVCANDAACDDSNVCTSDRCSVVSGGCEHDAVQVDDSNACTADRCHPLQGVTHLAVDPDDADVCTVDVCDRVMGVSHVARVDLDDGDACTADLCDPVTGPVHEVTSVDDGDACTTDACDSMTGPFHAPVALDDQNACTADSCDPVSGVLHAAVNASDDNPCTDDVCDPVTGLMHSPADIDDHDVCTFDSCDPSSGVLHEPLTVLSDGIACTDDLCDPVAGPVYVPINSRCERDGLVCTVGVCSASTGCSEVSTDALCDDGIACNQHLCVGVAGDGAGCAPRVSNDAKCGALQVCSATGCAAQSASDQRGELIISELQVFGDQVIELRNVTDAGIDARGYVLKNFNNASADIRSPGDPNGSAGAPVFVPANGQLYGVRNPASGVLDGGIGFVFGAAGTSFAFATTGDLASLFSRDGVKLEDTVRFQSFVSSPDAPLGPNAFAGSAVATSQLDARALNATANDSVTSWCVTFATEAPAAHRRISNTLGSANGSCSAVVLNEIAASAVGGDDGYTFVELAGPGGAVVGGMSIVDVSSDGGLAVDGDVGAGALERDGIVTIPAGTRLPIDGYLIIADGVNIGPNGVGASWVANVTPGVDLVVRDIDLSNGPASVQLISANGLLLDVVGHEPAGASLMATVAFNGLAMFEGSAAVSPAAGRSLGRGSESLDTNVNSSDFRALAFTPGKVNRILGASVSVHLTLGQPDFAEVNVATPDQYLLLKPQYVVSYNGPRRNPNYTAYELNASWKGQATRQNDFRADGTLPASITQASLADYSSSGWTRGHLCASDDRDATVADNSATFYLTNMLPQSANNNSGPWQKLEAYLQCLAVTQGKEIFIASGGLYEGAVRTTKPGSFVLVPSHTWKVATILDAAGQGVADVTSATRSIAVIMANDDSLISISAAWRPFRVSVREIELRTGYDLHSDVPLPIQDSIEVSIDALAATCTCPGGNTCASGTY